MSLRQLHNPRHTPTKNLSNALATTSTIVYASSMFPKFATLSLISPIRNFRRPNYGSLMPHRNFLSSLTIAHPLEHILCGQLDTRDARTYSLTHTNTHTRSECLVCGWAISNNPHSDGYCDVAVRRRRRPCVIELESNSVGRRDQGVDTL